MADWKDTDKGELNSLLAYGLTRLTNRSTTHTTFISSKVGGPGPVLQLLYIQDLLTLSMLYRLQFQFGQDQSLPGTY